MHKIYWCKGGLKLVYIATKNVSEHNLTPIMKYIMIRLDNWDRTLVQEGWQRTGSYMEQEFCITRLDLIEDSTKSVWNIWRTFKTVCSRSKTVLLWMKKMLKENHV